MKILKYLFFLLLIVVIAGAIYFATKDGKYNIQSSAVIAAPQEMIFEKANEFRTWENWGPWKKDDPAMVFNYPEKTSGEGASYSWNSKDGDGSMKTITVIPYSRIEQQITFNTPLGERTSDVIWEFEEAEGGTKVVWSIQGEHPLTDKAYFAIAGYDFDEEMRKMFQRGLEGLEESVKADMKVYSISVDGVTQYSGGFYMYASSSTTLSGISAKMGQLLGQVDNFMKRENITVSGKPMTIYNQYNPEGNSAIISCAIPTTSQVIVPAESTVLCGFMPSQTAIKTVLKGNYSNLEEAWNEAMKYISENGYAPDENNPPFELYANDPGEVKNPAEWITEIYVPILAPAAAQSDSL